MLPNRDALAHAAERGFVMLLPTGYYLFGGAVAVAATFAVMAIAPRFSELRGTWRRPVLPMPGPALETTISLVSLAFLCALVAAGFSGTRDPLTNPLPLTIWTFWWVCLTLLHGLFGNLWSALNPWIGAYRLLRMAGGLKPGSPPPLALPAGLGVWPAIALFFGFAWFELIDPAPDDPARLALAVSVYWLITFTGLVAFGDTWLRHGECFSIFFRYIASLAPFRVDDDERRAGRRTLFAGPPGWVALEAPPLPVSAVLFILLTLASVSFDGLSKTFWWLGLWGINPLEFPGRTAVIGQNSLGLIATWAVLASAYAVAIAIGWRWAGRSVPFTRALGGLVLSIVPISLAFHFAHYLTVVLVNGQYAVAAATDPFGSGADFLGVGTVYVTTSFLNNQSDVEVIWQFQSGAIIVGHVAAVVLAHAMARRLFGDARSATLSQIPLAILMVAYTVFGLWLLATPVAA